jgi:peroxiredoxin
MQQEKRRRMRKLESKSAARNRPQQPLKTKKMVKRTDSVLGPGKTAPNFSLNSTPDQKVSLKDFRGQPVILAFYPADWSPVCTDQLSLYAMVMPEFKKFNAELLAISVDNIWSHLAFAKDRKLNFPVLADFEPKGVVSRKYGAYKDKIGESARALFVIDDKGIIRWSHLSPDGINPGADGILAALESMNKAQETQKS